MRVSITAPLLVLVMAVPLGLAPARPAVARIQDQRALDQLGPAAAPKSPPHPHRAHHAGRHDTGHAAHATAVSPKAAMIKASPPIPAAPPPPPVFKAPLIDVPLHPEPPPPPVPVVARAVGVVSPIDGGSRITFGDGSADLNPAGMQALQAFQARLKADPDERAQIDAYGRGTADDPSTPRRISLARGLAARAVLINGGVPSTRIYVRAIGQPSDSGPPDRIDITTSQNQKPAPSGQPTSEKQPTSDKSGPDPTGATTGKVANPP